MGRFARLSSLILLISTPVVTCWLLGGVDVWVQVVVFSLLIAAICAWAVASFGQNVIVWRSATGLLLLGAICLGMLQCVVLPLEVVGVLSPGSVELRRLLVDGETASLPLSLAAALTRSQTALLAMIFITFVLSSQVFSRTRNQKWLFWVLAVNGAVLAAIGLLLKIKSDSMFSVVLPGKGFASFEVRNHAAGFLNICLAATLGLIFETWRGTNTSQHYELPAGNSHTWSQKAMDLVLRASGSLTAPKLAAVLLAICIICGIFATLSRGGIISLAFAAFVVLIGLNAPAYRKLRLRVASGLILVAVGAVALTNFAGQYDRLADRLETLDNWHTYEARFNHVADMLPAIPDFWLCGSGLGTYGDMNRIYQRSWLPGEKYFRHAENQYLEALIEGGVIGLGFMLACVLFVCRSIVRLLRQDQLSLPIAVCGCFAMASQVMHATCDFGLYLPANAAAFAIICGAVVGRDGYLRHQLAQSTLQHNLGDGQGQEKRDHFVRSKQLAVIGGMLMISLLALRELRSVQRAEQVISDPASRLFGWEPSLSPTDRLQVAHEVLEDRPDDARVQLFAAEMYIDRYRGLAADQLRQELGNEVDQKIIDNATSLQFLHRRVSELKRAGADADVERIRGQAVIQENLQPARAHLLAAQRANPTLFRVHIQLAALSFLDDAAQDQVHLERARLISPTHPDVLYWIGLIELTSGRNEMAWARWKECLNVSKKFTDQIVDEAHKQLPTSEVIDKVLPDNPAYLVELSKSYYSGLDHEADWQLVLARAESLLPNADMSNAETHYIAATIDQMQGESVLATSHYERALELSPNEVTWHVDFAKFLLQQGNFQGARKHASLATYLEPKNKGHERLFQRIVRLEKLAADKGPNRND